MSKILWNYWLAIPAVFSGIVVCSTIANATEAPKTTESELQSTVLVQRIAQTESKTPTTEEITQSDPVKGQITSVSQLSDVRPTDWAFQALQSLIERYGVITGLPDGTFQGNRPLTRYEFAAGLNATLDRVNEIVFNATEDTVKQTDIATLQKLQADFADELQALRGRVDKLEARTAQIEANQFSTTTKLQGTATFLIADTFGDRANNTSADDTKDDTQTFASYRVDLNLQTSFTGKDQLTTGLQSSTIPNTASNTGTHMTRFATEGTGSSDGSLGLVRLYYRFPVGKNTTVWVGAKALQPAVFLPTLNPLVGGASGAVSRFSSFNHTVYRPGFEGTGIAFAHKFSPQLQLNAGAIADNTLAKSPEAGKGLFNGNNLLIAQLTLSPSKQLDLGLTYARKYFGNATGFNLTGGTGSTFARNPFEQKATASDNFGFQFNWKTSSRLHLGGWVGYTKAHQLSGGDSEATIAHGALTIGLPDLFKKGNIGGFVIGVPPKVTESNYRSTPRSPIRENKDTSLHLEAFYTFKLNSNISVTPNLFFITNPEHNSNNSPIWVGALRTTFTF
ncbi:iron uptake porin [Calothrix sp. 336/3]|uniref:iron uptake porin n=1 Tax=Calothrix sp. 336/3 TaxID=1337936 RepID=UPI0004E2D4F8|nr:iron uptake porin [Calothrix sp. 336/3]AKG21456.1 membrane protein [Calothrix sp. 336/3]